MYVSSQIQMRLCFLRHQDDAEFDFDARANELGLDYTQILHRGPFDTQVLSKLSDVMQTFQLHVVHLARIQSQLFELAVESTTAVRHAGHVARLDR
ncbi:MAG: hypothetical protein R3C28_25615 [Pirellulaceae bacterium]